MTATRPRRGQASSPHPYIPNTEGARRAMLDAAGVATADDLFADIPPGLRIDGLDLPPALSEQELVREMAALAGRNQVPGDGVASGGCFLGGGAFLHLIPPLLPPPL